MLFFHFPMLLDNDLGELLGRFKVRFLGGSMLNDNKKSEINFACKNFSRAFNYRAKFF